MSFYKGYYLQHGNGYMQHGNGLGNVLSGIVRAAIPIASKTIKGVAKAAGKQILRKGLDHLENMSKNVHPLQTSFSFAPAIVKRKKRKQKRIGRHIIQRKNISTKARSRKNQKGGSTKRNKTVRRCESVSSKNSTYSRKRGYKRKRNINLPLSILNKRRRKDSHRTFDIFSQ